MSKIIESLKTQQTKEVQAKEVPSKEPVQPKEIQRPKSGRELTQQQLADIYFAATGKSKSSEPPIIIRVIEKPRYASLIPWIIASVAFLITAFSLFSSKRIFVHIRVVDDKSMYARTLPSEVTPPLAGGNRGIVTPDHRIITNINRIPLEDFTFEGASYLKSSKDASGLSLVNSSVAPFARAVKNFDIPLNLSRAKIMFYARGARGGENIAFALKDADNVQAFYKGKIYPFKNGLTTEWQMAEITPADMTKEFDATSVSSMRFEFGSKDTGNKSGDTIYIKDLQWVSP